MKLAEALAERAALNTKLNNLLTRLEKCIRVQEGDSPPEDPNAVAKEYSDTSDAIEQITIKINAKNNVTHLSDGTTLSAAIVKRDALKRIVKLYRKASEDPLRDIFRYSRNEIKQIITIDLTEWRRKAEEAEKQRRDLDSQIQRINWSEDI